MTRVASPAALLLAALVLLGLLIPLNARAQATVPGTPTVDEVTARAGWLLVEWLAPSSDGGSTITAYDVRYIETDASNKADDQWTEEADAWVTGGGDLRYSLEGLTNDTQYDVQVRAVNDEGNGAWSATVTGTPELSEGTRATLTMVRGDDGAVAVTWNPPTTLVDTDTTYDLRYIETDATNKSDGEWTEKTGANTDNLLLYGITGLTNNTEYDVQVRAVEFATAGPWSNTMSATPADYRSDLNYAREITLATTSSGELDPMGSNYFWGRIDERETYNGFISSSDWDSVKLVITDEQAPNPMDFEIFTEGSLDTSGTLFDGDGDIIAQVGNGPGLPNPDNFLIRYTLESGTYYIRVLADAGVTGEYVLRIKAAPETTGPADPKKLTVGGSVSGTISPPNETDSYDLELTERTDVIIRGWGLPDVTAQLVNEHGTVLAQNNDGNLHPKPEGFLIRRLLDAGTYELKVSSHRGVTSGGYTVYTSDAGNPGSTVAAAQAIALERAAGGNITSTSDADYFSITVDDTTYVQIWAAPNTSGTDVDAEIVDIGGTAIDVDFNEKFSGRYARIFSFGIAHELDAGTHYLKVTGAGNSTGRYTVIAVEDWGFARMVDTCQDVSRGGISDTWYGCQWHLQDDGLSGSDSTEDINVEGVWSGGNLGAGITVAIVDQGMDHQHEDLTDNVDTSRNHDFVGQGGIYHPFETHGTAVAGIIAARDNSIGTRGVAPRATIYGYNLLSTGNLNDEFDAMSLNAATTAVSNNSWGEGNTGSPEYAPSMWVEVIENAVTTGYGGKGVFYVWSAGNGAENGDYSTLDERNNFYAVTAACAVSIEGVRANYSEMGANLWVCAPSKSSRKAGIATTTNSNRYTNAFGGTSAAAPIVSGVAALVRKANNALTWRDVKLILAASARKNDASNSGWETGASKYGDTGTYNFNHEYGFGVVDAQAAVNLANGWTNLPGLRQSTVESGTINLTIPDATSTDAGATATSKLTVGSHVEFVEYVHVDAHFDHDSFRHLDVELESPDGKVSKLAPYFDQTAFGSDIPRGFTDNPLRLGSAKHLGESAAGEWTLRVTDHISGHQGVLEDWSITVFGHGTKPTAPSIDEVQPTSGGFTVAWTTPADPGASAITGYQVHHIRSDATDKADSNWTSATTGSSARQYTTADLDGGVEYDVRVRAVNSDGNGPWSTTGKVTADSADAPTITSVTSVEQTLITKWAPPANSGLGTVTSYDLRHKFTNFGDWTTVDSIWATGGGDLEYTLTPSIFLGYGRPHYVQLRAVVGTTEHPWSASRTVVTVPNAPAITTITADPGGGKINVPWAHAVSNSQFPVTSYDLRYIETSKDETVDANWTVKTGVWPSREGYTIEGLTNWVQYDLQVRGWNAGGPGPWSATETGTPVNTAVPVTLHWEKTAVDVNEDAGSVTLKAIAATDRDEALPSDFTFEATVTTDDVTATESADYVAPSNGTLTFQQSDFERVSTGSGFRYRATREFNVTILSDDVDETNETFTATLDYAGTAPTNLLGGNSVATITINDVNNNRAPVFEDGSSTTRSIDENSAQGTAVGAPVAATDLNGDTLTYSIASQQGGPYTVDDTTGQIRVGAGAILDYERRTTQRVNLKVEDTDGLSDTIQVNIQIANVNEPPVINGNGAVNWQENRTGNITRYTAADPERDSVEWTLGGADDGFFSIDSNGYLTFNDPPDFEDKADQNGDGVYEVTVVATDTDGSSGNLDASITVTNVNEPPTVDGRTTLALSENDDSFDERYTAVDPEGSSTTFTWSVSGPDGGDFTINRDTGVLTFRNTPDYERPADSNSNNEYLVQVRASDGQYTGTLDVTVTVADVNEPPQFNSSSLSRTLFSYAENRTSALYTYRATDPERKPINWSVSGTDGDDFNISSSGVLTFAEIPDFEMPDDADQDNRYLVTVVAEDDNFNRATLDVAVTVTNSTGLEEPTITTTSTPSPYRENGTGAVYTFRARDPQGRAMTWSLRGDDANVFIITTDGGVLTFRSAPNFENPTDRDRDNRYEITVVVTDDQGLTDSVDVTITVTNHNEGVEPTISSRSPPSTYQENRTSTVYTFSASDPQRQTVTWTLEGNDRGDFTLTTDSSGRGVLAFATPPDFEAPADSDGQNDYELTVVATDPDLHADRLSVTITVSDVNEGPEVISGGDSFTVQENRNWPGATFTASDPEGGSVTRWSLGGRDGGDFAITSAGRITFRNTPDFERPDDADRDNTYEVEVRPYDGQYYGSHPITVTVQDVSEITGPATVQRDENFTGTLASYGITGRGDLSVDPTWRLTGADGGDFAVSPQGEVTFRYIPDHERPADYNRDNVYSFAVQVSDGRYYDTYEVTANVTPVNEPPTITTTSRSATTMTHPENRTSRLYTYRATDPEGAAIMWSVGGVDGRFFAIDDRGQFSFNSINPPDFEARTASGLDHIYHVTIQAGDGTHTASLPVAVTVTDVNEGPEVTDGRASFTITENRNLTGAAYTAIDPEGAYVTRWSVGGRDSGDFFITQGGTLYFRTPPDFERPADANKDNVYEVIIQPYDGRNTGSFAVTITVTDVNEPPEFRSGSRTHFTQPENRAARLYTFSATDPERGAVTWSVGGTDGRFFAIDERGQFSFDPNNPPDFDVPGDSGRNNTYNLNIEATDPEFNTASLPVTVVVTEVNEGPVITRRGSLNDSVRENHPTSQALATYTASDPERPSVRITRWTTSGPDGGDFVMNALGELRFRNSPDYERPADSNRDNVYQVTIRASDGRNTGTLEEVQVVTVADVNEPPVITTTGRTAFTQPENRNTVLYTFRATDPEREDISWTAAGTEGRFFTVDDQGRFSFTNPPDFENPTDAGRDNVYNVTIEARDPEFNSAGLEVTVTVTNHNEGVQPTISTRRPPSTYQENRTNTVYTFRASDPQRSAIGWSLAGPDAGDFTISVAGALTFNTPPDFENPADSDGDNVYELTVITTDAEGHTDRVSFTITVTNHNEGVEPTISTRRPPSTYQENRTTAIYTFRASDPQRDPISWSLTGTDAGAFTLTTDSSGRGVLAFLTPPDFESPVDSDRDNVYVLAVIATDTDGNRDRADFSITVTDVNEVPSIMVVGTATTTVPENYADTAVIARYTARDPENPGAGIYSWSTTGRDGGDFVISALGELRFRASPDYERPADYNRDNVYEVIVRASDGRSYGMLTEPLIVTVTNLNEAPIITTKSRTEFTVRENSTSTVYTYRATDQDQDDRIRWLIEGADANDFAIYNGMLTFRRLPDLEQPVDDDRDNVYEISVVAADNGRLRDTIDATITVTDQSEGPVIAGTTTFSVAENYDIAQALGTYTATDAKDGRRVYPQWSLSGRDGGDFVIDRYSGVLSFRNTPDYDRPADSNRDNVYEVTIRGHDSRAYGQLNVVVTVTNINEGAPVVTGSTARTVRENTASTIYTYRATDSDLGDTITWSTGGADGRHFVITEDRYGRGLLAFAIPPDFEDPADSDRDNIYRLDVVATDGAGLRGTLAVSVTVTALNEGPVVSGAAAFTVNENQALADNQAGSSTTYTARDPEAIGGVTTTITWSVAGRDGGDFTIDRETGVLTFRNPPDHERPADYNRDNVYELTVRAYDGRSYGTFDVTVTVLAVNEGPEITGRDVLSFRENTPVTTRLYTYRAADPEGDGFTWELGGPDAGDFAIATDSSGRGMLTFASPPNFDIPSGSGAHGNEYLVTVRARDDQGHVGELPVTVTVTDQNEGAVVSGRTEIAVQENYDPTLVLATYSATDPEGQPITRWYVSGVDGGDFTISADGELTFRNIPDYDRPADSNRDNEYRITVRAYDGRTYGDLNVTVTVSNINEHDPVIRSGSRTSFAYREESASVLYTYYATDQDKDDVITWSVGGTDGHLFAFNDRNGLVFQSPPNYEIPVDSGRDNAYNLTVVATDSGGRFASLDITVTVSPVDEGPEIFGTINYTVAEGQELTGATFTATDPEDPSIVVSNWRTSGTDGGDFTITQDGVLSFRNIPDYDRPADSNRDNIYLVIVQVSDGRYYGSLEVTVTVTDENESAPVVTGRDTLTFRENTASTLYTYRVTDADRNTVFTWSVRGTDGGDFAINSDGQLTFSSPPDHERPADSNGDNVYEITVVASDGLNEGVLAVTITVTEVNEGPEISGAQTLTFNENTPTDRVLANYTGVDPEDTSANIIRWSTSGRDGGDFTINSDGELTFRYPPNHERPADANRDNVYELTVRASDGRVYGSYDVVVTVLPVDEAPEFRSGSRDSFTYRENGTSILYTYRATDPEGAGVTWSVGGADAGYFAISETGVLTFSEPPNFENPARFDGEFYDTEYDVTVQATDENGNTARLEVVVTVTDVNEGPEITGCTDTVSDTVVVIAFEDCDEITVSENHDEPLYTYAAQDPEIPDLEITRWTLSGRDGGDFTITEDGELSFRYPPDSERPADSNQDDVYELTVRASDGRYYGSFDVTVTVEAVDEAPEFQRNSKDTFTYKENGTAALYTYRATDPEGSEITWGLGGADGHAFAISETGALTFGDAPDYEAPTDSGRDNVYEVVVEVRDENGNTRRLEVTVTVTNLTD